MKKSARECIVFWTLVLVTQVSLVPVHAYAEVERRDGTFPLTAFGQNAALDRGAISKGIEALFLNTPICPYGPCQTPAQLAKRTDQAVSFHQSLRDLTDRQRRTYNGQLPFRDQVYRYGPFGAFERHDFVFASAVQRPGGNHPSDSIRGFYLVPRRIGTCPRGFGTFVLVHSSVDDIVNKEQRIAEFLVSASQGMGVMVIDLPHFGARRLRYGNRLADGSPFVADDFDTDFFTPDLADFKLNLAQSALDLHTAIDWLRAQPNQDPQNIVLSGLSWGGAIAPLYAGLDPQPYVHAQVIYVGGGDLASVMTHAAAKYPGEPSAKAWIRRGWDESRVREALFSVDPVVWAHRIHNKNMYWINALKDSIMRRTENLDKLRSVIPHDNVTSERWNDSDHDLSKDGDFFVLTHLILPIMNFTLDQFPPPPKYDCTY